MLEGALIGVVVLLALAGGVALLGRAWRSGVRFALRTAEVTAASGLVEISLRRGDLTGLAERQSVERQARSRRRREGLLTLVWLLWLIIPIVGGWLPGAYALAAPLWMVSVGRGTGPPLSQANG